MARTSRNTAPNSTHCSSSHEFEEVSNSLRIDGVDGGHDDGREDQPGQNLADAEIDRVDDAAHSQARSLNIRRPAQLLDGGAATALDKTLLSPNAGYRDRGIRAWLRVPSLAVPHAADPSPDA